MVRCCLAFGPNDGFIFMSPTRWSSQNFPSEICDLARGPPACKEIYEVALAPNGAFCVIYSAMNGQMMLTRDRLPNDLETWLVPISGGGVSAARDLPTLNVCLGPNESFFAFDKNGAIWDGLPDAFETALVGLRTSYGSFLPGKDPQGVSLGADDTYIMTTVDGGGIWDLRGTNDFLHNYLSQLKTRKNLTFVLSPCHTGTSLVISTDGATSANVPPSTLPYCRDFQNDWRDSVHREKRQVSYGNAAHQASHIASGGMHAAQHLYNAVNDNANNFSNAGGGGGGDNSGFWTDTFGNILNNAGSTDPSSFWDPISNVASAFFQ
ncbi:hypothetical protein EDD37DRAFT_159577 [Exophiala viscosa]|uniref:Uncharacterized protein n=1 Tax=Exophiala viscosa TaxID=2486360 RepID=A0AAN6DNS1_9EURO|nr:hypothetical protein EDD36DRAFT_70449 [Exophiala viscosa]KAI1620560.1 hypothetical protein EDD37DRAFT_159577 [Exophiala viscosa]